MATAGIVLTGLELGGSLRETRIAGRGVAIALVTMVLFAVLTILLAGPIKDHGWLPVMLGSRLTNAGIGVLLLVVALARRSGPLGSCSGRPAVSPGARSCSSCWPGRATSSGSWRTPSGSRWRRRGSLGSASSFGPALVVLIAVAFLGERLRPSQWLGLAMLAGGLLVLAVAA